MPDFTIFNMNDICCIGHITKDKIITLGSNGSLIFADGEFHDIPAYRPGEMVDECLMPPKLGGWGAEQGKDFI